MNRFVNSLLRSSISASLSDRDSFVEKISAIIQEKVGSDPEQARSISDKIATAMEQIDHELLINQILSPDKNEDKLIQKIDALTESINKLNESIERLQK